MRALTPKAVAESKNGVMRPGGTNHPSASPESAAEFSSYVPRKTTVLPEYLSMRFALGPAPGNGTGSAYLPGRVKTAGQFAEATP